LKPSGRSRGVRDQFCDDVVDLLGGRAQRQQSAKRLKVAAPRGAGEALPGPGVAASHGQTTLFQPSFAAWPVTRRIKSRLPKIAPKNRSNADEMAEKLERVSGIEPPSKAWDAVLGPLILLSISGRSLLVSVLDVRGDSPVFAEILNDCAKLCQAFERCCAP
jgi:hypothetical protein